MIVLAFNPANQPTGRDISPAAMAAANLPLTPTSTTAVLRPMDQVAPSLPVGDEVHLCFGPRSAPETNALYFPCAVTTDRQVEMTALIAQSVACFDADALSACGLLLSDASWGCRSNRGVIVVVGNDMDLQSIRTELGAGEAWSGVSSEPAACMPDPACDDQGCIAVVLAKDLPALVLNKPLTVIVYAAGGIEPVAASCVARMPRRGCQRVILIDIGDDSDERAVEQTCIRRHRYLAPESCAGAATVRVTQLLSHRQHAFQSSNPVSGSYLTALPAMLLYPVIASTGCKLPNVTALLVWPDQMAVTRRGARFCTAQDDKAGPSGPFTSDVATEPDCNDQDLYSSMGLSTPMEPQEPDEQQTGGTVDA